MNRSKMQPNLRILRITSIKDQMSKIKLDLSRFFSAYFVPNLISLICPANLIKV